ncbi:NRDE family protein [Bacillus sp. REN3]|uniref:NRDE family protein n=1 Tax=Bacillus sp. REN3 TaxID=2802440 RepID=UPI001AED92CF|nr:NRDE family protein [Bacillus sp. REN3]
MCLILFAYKSHPKYSLIIAANRDEFYHRPTAPAGFWKDEPTILAGRDLEKLGTWMGVTSTGRFAALTNFRDPSEVTEGKRSRGELVADFLRGKDDPRTYLEEAAKKRELYPGYNLLAGDQSQLYYYSNKNGAVHEVQPGIHGVSNHLLDTDWPKVKLGKAGLADTIEKNESSLAENLFDHLANADPAEDHFLPSTGVSLEWERLLSPMFIRSEGYGTRSSTVILMNDEEIFFKERVFNGAGHSDREFEIKIKG